MKISPTCSKVLWLTSCIAVAEGGRVEAEGSDVWPVVTKVGVSG